MDHDEMDDMVVENNNAYLMAMGEGSRIEIHAADVEKESWTQLETTAEAGSNQLVVQEETDWEIGDKIAIASTSDDWEEAEEFTILEISEDGKTITLDGDLQYTHNGFTQTYDNGQEGEDHLTWDVEIRAEVALLSRNVTIQGDADSVDDGFGGHTMVMDGAAQHIEGAEFFRMGQIDTLGRYPIHWHMLGVAEGQYVEGVSVHHSYQKGSTIHGTSNIRYEDNVIFDHIGHGVFLEDGSENDNQFYGNLVFSTRVSETAEPIPTDGEHASSYWIENPNNAFIGNHAAGSESNGFWIFEGQLHGLSVDTYVGDSGQLHDLIFIGNAGHSTTGQNGAGGTDKILGIDGRIDDDLDFVQSTLVAEFGVIEGFTAYSGEVWALTHELVFSNSAFIDVRFFTRHENVIEDTVFDDGTVVLYRDGGAQYSDVLFTGTATISTISSNHVNTPHAFDNVVDDASNVIHTVSDVNQQVIVDIDGAYTGVAGAFLTPGGDNAVFNAAPGAEAFDNGFISEYTIGATEITALGIDGAVRVLRSNGDSIASVALSNDSRVQGDDNEDASDANYEIYTTTGMPQDLAYLIDFEDAPEDLILNLANVREGESAVYEVQNITAIGEVTGGVEVGSLTELVNSDETAYLLLDDSLFIRIVADDVEVQDERPVVDLLADYRAFGKIEITGLVEGDNEDAGVRELSEDLLDAIATMPVREAADPPEVAEAVVDPNVSYIGYDLKMTEAQSVGDVTDTAAHGDFEVNYDVTTRTVSISGSFDDLSSDITMLHLHSGAAGETGGIISSLTFDTDDSRNGVFAGSFELTADEAEQFLAGETYVNLHTVDNPTGELRGQVEVYAAGDFVLDRYDSTSDTTVVTDGMARWSETRAWGENGVPGADDIVVIGAGETVVLDVSTTVKGIIVDGGELIIEDGDDLEIELSTDYLLVINGGLFQAGAEDDLLDTDFTLTLEGDDPDFDLHVTQILMGHEPNTVFASAEILADEDDTGHDHDDEAESASGTPIIYLLGQSNALYLDNSEAMEEALADIGSDAMVVGVHGAGLSVADVDGPWNIVETDGGVDGGSSYEELLQTHAAILEETPDAYIAGAVWLQGEVDVHSDELVANYYDATEALFSQMRTDLPGDYLITIIGLSTDTTRLDDEEGRAERWNAVRDVQSQLADDLENTNFIDPDELVDEFDLTPEEIAVDDVHYADVLLRHISDAVLAQPEMLASLGLDTTEDHDDEAHDDDAHDDDAHDDTGSDVMPDMDDDADTDDYPDTDDDVVPEDPETEAEPEPEETDLPSDPATTPEGAIVVKLYEALVDDAYAFIVETELEAGSVRFTSGGETYVDNTGPFSLAIDPGVAAGLHEVTVEVFSEADAGGDLLANESFDVEVRDDPDESGVQIDTVTVRQTDADTWFRVDFDAPIEDAVVIMGPVSDNGRHSAMTRIKNVDETGFEFQIDEWEYLNGAHRMESITWMAASAGDYEMDDGRMISFGKTTAVDEDKTSVALDGFDGKPIVVAQVGGAGGHAVTTRLSHVTEEGFNVQMQEQEASTGVHVEETIYWMAVEEGEGDLTALREHDVDYLQSDTGIDMPEHFVGDIQTFNGDNTAVLRYGETETGDISLHIQEERSLDAETYHVEEIVGLVHANEDYISLNLLT